jgi:hypothetical protein
MMIGVGRLTVPMSSLLIQAIRRDRETTASRFGIATILHGHVAHGPKLRYRNHIPMRRWTAGASGSLLGANRPLALLSSMFFAFRVPLKIAKNTIKRMNRPKCE